MVSQIEKIIFGGRFLLLPMYLGLILALSVYAIRFGAQVWELLVHALTLNDSEILVLILGLLDVIMVCHLIVMVMIGGFVLFITGSFEDDCEQAPHLPRLKWLGHIDPGTLKVKMSMSILGVSTIHLLGAFVDAANQTPEYLTKLVAVHLVFVVSTMAVAWVNRYAFQH